MLNVQEYLQNHTLEELEDQFGIVITRYPDRVVLNYSQVSSPKFDSICDECRGLILSLPDFRVLCRSFDRFYNLGEGGYFHPDEFSISRAEVQQKIDGSNINCYFDGNEWCYATRKMAFAEGETAQGNTYKSIVQKALGFKISALDFVLGENARDYTLICEIVSPENRIVIPYPEYKLYILAMRNKHTGEYRERNRLIGLVHDFGYRFGANIGLPTVYSMDSVDDVVDMAKSLDPMEEDGEGYVCYDVETGNRVKIKNPAYVAIHHLRENGAISINRIIDLVFQQEYAEYLNAFPKDHEFFDPYIKAFDKMTKNIHEIYNNYKDIEDQKEFALNVKDLSFAGILFQMRKGASLSKALDSLSKKARYRLIQEFVGRD